MSIVKKIFLTSSIILVFALLLWGVYNLSFKKSIAPEKNALLPEKTAEKAPAPPAATGVKIKAISDEAAISPVYVPGENAIKYYSKTGPAYQIDANGGAKKMISSQELPGLSGALWSSDQTKTILRHTDPNGQSRFFYYDYSTQKGVPIKNNVDEIAWQTSGNKIFYKYYDQATKKRSLNISDPDGTNWTKLADIDYRNISIAQIPQSGLVSFWNKADSFSETIFESIPTLGGERKPIYKGKFGADYLWNRDGSLVLVSNADQRTGTKMQLAVMNYNGGEYRNLDAPTFVSKCIWSRDGKTVYYALPGNIPNAAILPNEYDEGKFKTTDTFWKLNISDTKKERVVEPTDIKDAYDATDLFLSDDEGALFFTNKTDGKLYRINL